MCSICTKLTAAITYRLRRRSLTVQMYIGSFCYKFGTAKQTCKQSSVEVDPVHHPSLYTCRISRAELEQSIDKLFENHPALVEGFAKFYPPGS
jgi:hypothetical protein